MNAYEAAVLTAFMIFGVVIVVAVAAYNYLTARNEIDTALRDAFSKQDAKEKP